MLTALHTGPRTRGTGRKTHEFTDGSRGDVYRAILLAIKRDPAELAFTYEKIITRVKEICSSEPPIGLNITSALEALGGGVNVTPSNASPVHVGYGVTAGQNIKANNTTNITRAATAPHIRTFRVPRCSSCREILLGIVESW